MGDEEDAPETIDPELAKKDAEDLEDFRRLLAFPTQIHVLVVRHAYLGRIPVHFMVLPEGESQSFAPDAQAWAKGTAADRFKLFESSGEKFAWAMIDRAMKADLPCLNPCCKGGPIKAKHRFTRETWDAIRASNPDFVKFVSAHLQNFLTKEGNDFLSGLGIAGSES